MIFELLTHLLTTNNRILDRILGRRLRKERQTPLQRILRRNPLPRPPGEPARVQDGRGLGTPLQIPRRPSAREQEVPTHQRHRWFRGALPQEEPHADAQWSLPLHRLWWLCCGCDADHDFRCPSCVGWKPQLVVVGGVLVEGLRSSMFDCILRFCGLWR